jgi:hypothetical protein
VSEQDWDPYETYVQEQFRLALFSSVCSFRPDEEQGSENTVPRKSSNTASTISVAILSPADKSQLLTRVRCLPIPPTVASAQMTEQRPTLPPIVVPPTLTVSVEESHTFVLSRSDFDSTTDETRSVTSYAETIHLSFPDNITCAFPDAKRSLSNLDLRGREGFMNSVDIINPEELPIYYPSPETPTIGSPLSVSEASCYSNSSWQSQTVVPSIRLSADSTTVSRHRAISENSLFTTPSLSSVRSVRPLPRVPVIIPDRSRWVPPSAWDRHSKAVELEELLSTDAGKKSSRPLSVLDFLKEDYAQQIEALKSMDEAPAPKPPRQPRQRRPGTAPDDKRPALTFDTSPLIALDQRADIQNSVKFHRNTVPSQGDLELASKLEVIAENGTRIPFGSLFRDQKTVVSRPFCGTTFSISSPLVRCSSSGTGGAH